MSRTFKRRVAQVEDALKIGSGHKIYLWVGTDTDDVAEAKIQEAMKKNCCLREQIVPVILSWVDGNEMGDGISVKYA